MTDLRSLSGMTGWSRSNQTAVSEALNGQACVQEPLGSGSELSALPSQVSGPLSSRLCRSLGSIGLSWTPSSVTHTPARRLRHCLCPIVCPMNSGSDYLDCQSCAT
jgi:hypothetical protein